MNLENENISKILIKYPLSSIIVKIVLVLQ